MTKLSEQYRLCFLHSSISYVLRRTWEDNIRIDHKQINHKQIDVNAWNWTDSAKDENL